MNTKRILLNFVFCVMFIGGPLSLLSNGFKYIKNYSNQEYNNQPQNWAVLQDKRGVIYMANQGGLMEFDGVSWRICLIPPNRVVRSISIDDTPPYGTIYIGGLNEIGFAAPDKTGKLEYVSLRGKLPPNTLPFSEVYATYSIGKMIYFQSKKYLFRWNTSIKKIHTFDIDTQSKSAFLCNGKLYIELVNKGLSILEDDTFVPLPGIQTARSKIRFILPYNNGDRDRILIGTDSAGIFLYDGIKTVPFPTAVDQFLKDNGLYTGIRLFSTPEEFAFGTSYGGLAIIDFQGKLKYKFDRTSGLPVDTINSLFEDIDGNLWLLLEKGLSKLEYASPFDIYDDRNDLSGLGLSVAKHQGILFEGTQDGLFYLSSSGKFNKIPIKAGACRSLLSTKDSLMAGFSNGIYRVTIENNTLPMKVVKIIDKGIYVLYHSRKNSNRIWAGGSQELITLSRLNETAPWTLENTTPIEGHEIKSILEDECGNIWMGTGIGDVFKFNFSNGTIKGNSTHFSKSHGLPVGSVSISTIAGHVVFLTEKGLARLNEKEELFFPDNTLGNDFSMSAERSVFRLIEDKSKNIWFHSASTNYHARLKPDKTYHIISRPFLRIPLAQVNHIYPDEQEKYTWFASTENLIRYDYHNNKNSPSSFNALIRKVKLIKDIEDKEIVFNGFQENNNPGSIPHEFEYKDRDIRIEFAAPFFEDEKSTTYRYRLDGYDDNWSPFTSETKKDYTNLGGGTYTFHVQAKNVYGDLSKEDSIKFIVKYPWYQTWWAYLIYAASLFTIMYLIIRLRSHKLVKEKLRLEHIIEVRTEEIQNKNIQLETQSEKLKELDEAKSRFFANVSHEFRTPLTLLIGPLEQILSRNPDNELKSQAEMMLRNSHRLLNLVNQLLELARFDSGTMKLQSSQHNAVLFTKNIVQCFESLANHEKITLSFHSEETDIPLFFDPDKLEKIFSNLISNAFNYTPAGGEITITIQRDDSQTEIFPSGCVNISICDTGVGIPEAQLPHIFDRFFRVEGNYEYKRKGTGIGLALTKEAIDLLHGTIRVTSNCTDNNLHGTQFIVSLPLGKDHLKPEEIVQTEEITPCIPSIPSITNEFASTQNIHETDFNQVDGVGDSIAEEEKPSILIVEDNPDVRDYIRSSLARDFHIEEAADGKQGIIRARDLIPDLVISDIMMPNADGFELCSTLKNDVLTSHIPIILLTARTGHESELKGLECGADDYITKPFSAPVLAARAANLIELRKLLQHERKNQLELQPVQLPASPLDDAFYNALTQTIEDKLSDPDLNVDTLAQQLKMSQATLYRKVIGITGITPVHFIRAYRLKRAAQFLETQTLSVAEVSVKTGFGSLAYFSKCFKEQFLMVPSQVSSAASIQMPTIPFDESPLPDSTHEPGTVSGIGPEMGLSQKSQPVILIVEDNDDARKYIRESLQSRYHIVEAIDGGEGIARAMEIIPDIIVSDVIMPGTDGFQLCEMLKSDVRTSHIPIILLTARASEEHIIHGLHTLADDYIAKPFNMELLLARISNLIRLREMLHLNRRREMVLMPVKIDESKVDKEFLADLEKVMKEHHSDPEFSVELLAEKLYISGASLYRKIKALTGESPADYIRSYRLNRAAKLFKNNFGTVTEVAFEVGFKNRTHFTRCFKEKFQCLPSDFNDI